MSPFYEWAEGSVSRVGIRVCVGVLEGISCLKNINIRDV